MWIDPLRQRIFCSSLGDRLFVAFVVDLHEPGDEGGARLDGHALTLLMVGVILPELEGLLGDDVVLVEGAKDGVQDAPRVLKCVHESLEGKQGLQLGLLALDEIL